MKKNCKEKFFIQNIAHISHELQTPVNLVASTAKIMNHMLEKGINDEEKFKEYTQNIINNCNKVSMMLSNIMDINIINPSNFEYVNSKQFFDEFCFNIKNYLCEFNVNFKTDFKCEEECIYIPVNTIERIILNLITNSLKYTNKKKPNITLKMYDNQNSIYFSVKDNGIGISEENIQKITQPFFRVDNTSSNGAGLGLTLVNEYISKLKGTLAIKSELKKGTEVIFSIPLKDKFVSDELDYIYKPEQSTFAVEFAQFKNNYYK